MDFADEALERLSRVAAGIRGRKMFGGVGIYSGDLFFGIVAFDRLWLKVDETTRGDYEARGSGPFRPFPDRPTTMQYFELPTDLLDDSNALHDWVARSIAVAKRAQSHLKKKRR